MKRNTLLVAFFCASLLAVAESTFLAAGASAGAAAVGVAAVIGGLAALKGAAILGFAIGRNLGGRRFRKSTETRADEDENLLLSTVGQLDPNGCILKLICLLQTKDQSTLTPEEDCWACQQHRNSVLLQRRLRLRKRNRHKDPQSARLQEVLPQMPSQR
nr:uncharacterized protein LOC113801011 [Penaeus vannamei]